MESSVSLKQEYEKLPRIGLNKDSDSSNCMVPILESKYDNTKLKDENLRKFNNCVPDDLILSIKQAEIPKEFLGPPSKKTLQNPKPAVPSILKRPDNAWNYEKQREKFKFLTEQPICSCGAGKDISFIYDCAVHQSASKTYQNPSKYDLSAVRISESVVDKSVKISDSLVPDEFHIVKSQGVWPLKVEEEKYTTLAEDHYNHLTVFPSLKPSGRNEVIKLKHTMEALLKRVGADIVDQKGPTQLHNLLEIIKQEQDIYNIVFHEVIRQVTVECKDRGEVLAKLRERYANLLSRVPREIKSLHEEIVAQRALDRRLTEELMQFKSTIEYLTEELTHVKQHDKLISEQATIYQKDLNNALLEAQKNASLLNEYHELYELQRKRLEKTIGSLIEERDIWTKTAYNIALKVTEENKLITAQRLNVAEKSWAKLARHFALLISDKDTKELNEIQKFADSWKNSIEELKLSITFKESQTRNLLEQMRLEVDRLKFILQPSTINNSEKGSKSSLSSPDLNKINNLLNQLKKIYEATAKDSENYSGDAVLASEDSIKKAERCLFQVVQLSNKIISRHEQAKDQAKVDKYMRYETLQAEIKQLQEQYRNRTSGDNGLSKSYATLNAGLDLWIQRFNSLVLGEKSGKNKAKLSDADWQAFMQSIDDWQETLHQALKSLGWPLRHVTELMPPSTLHEPEPEPGIVVHEDIFIEMHKWLTALFQHIDTQDACLIDEVNKNHKDMIYWMIQALIRLAPDRENLSNEVKKLIYNQETSVENLIQKADKLVETIEKFTIYLVDKASELVPNLMKKDSLNEANEAPNEAEKESIKLAALKEDCQEWMYTVKLLVGELSAASNYKRKKSLFSKFVETDHRSEREDSFREDQEVEAIEAKASETKQSDYPLASTTGESTAEETRKTDNETDNEAVHLVSATKEDDLEERKSQTKPNTAGASAQNKYTPTFEILTSDSNTQRKYLDNINLNEANQLSEAELKSTVFNAMNTIDKLQTQLVNTEERAQHAENQVNDLEMKLKEAMERIRSLEKKTPPINTSKTPTTPPQLE